MDMFSQGFIPKYERSLDVLTARHKIIGHNVANINTPAYRKKDIDFKNVLGNVFSNYEAVSGRTEQQRYIDGFERRIFEDMEREVKKGYVPGDQAHEELIREISQLKYEVEADFDDEELEPFTINPLTLNEDNPYNDVEMDEEMVKMSETKILYDLMIAAVQKRFSQVRSAIRESV